MCAAIFAVCTYILALFVVLAACIGRPFLIVPTIIILVAGFYFKAKATKENHNVNCN
jgi:hypothetical protein